MRLALTFIGMTLACATAQAGTASVRFVEPDKFMDAGHGHDLAKTQLVLAEHFKQLAGKVLPASQSLEIDVLDIDLAGEVRPWRQVWPETRVMRGAADWPRMTVRFTLRDGDRIVAQGEDRISDMNYLQGTRPTQLGSSEPLPYEKRMVTSWFSDRLIARR